MLDKLKSMLGRRQVEPELVKPPTVMVRAVGYCRTDGCEDFNRGKFVFTGSPEPTHFCTKCGVYGMVVKEEWHTKYADNMDFYQVRLEYNFTPSLVPNVHIGRWCCEAIVTDEVLPKTGNVYYMKSPLISTEKRALEVATSVLSALMRDPEETLRNAPGSRPRESIIDFEEDLGGVKSQLWELEQKLSNSRLVKGYYGQG